MALASRVRNNPSPRSTPRGSLQSKYRNKVAISEDPHRLQGKPRGSAGKGRYPRCRSPRVSRCVRQSTHPGGVQREKRRNEVPISRPVTGGAEKNVDRPPYTQPEQNQALAHPYVDRDFRIKAGHYARRSCERHWDIYIMRSSNRAIALRSENSDVWVLAFD